MNATTSPITARFRRPRRILWFVGCEVWSCDRRKTVFAILAMVKR